MGANRRPKRANRYRRPERTMVVPAERRQSHQCEPCGKRAWENRQAAKRAARVTSNADGGGALHAYRCPHDGRTWHVGHMGSDKSRAYYRERTEG